MSHSKTSPHWLQAVVSVLLCQDPQVLPVEAWRPLQREESCRKPEMRNTLAQNIKIHRDIISRELPQALL